MRWGVGVAVAARTSSVHCCAVVIQTGAERGEQNQAGEERKAEGARAGPGGQGTANRAPAVSVGHDAGKQARVERGVASAVEHGGGTDGARIAGTREHDECVVMLPPHGFCVVRWAACVKHALHRI